MTQTIPMANTNTTNSITVPSLKMEGAPPSPSVWMAFIVVPREYLDKPRVLEPVLTGLIDALAADVELAGMRTAGSANCEVTMYDMAGNLVKLTATIAVAPVEPSGPLQGAEKRGWPVADMGAKTVPAEPPPRAEPIAHFGPELDVDNEGHDVKLADYLGDDE